MACSAANSNTLILAREADALEAKLLSANRRIACLEDAIRRLLACPSGMYCDAYPDAQKYANDLLA